MYMTYESHMKFITYCIHSSYHYILFPYNIHTIYSDNYCSADCNHIHIQQHDALKLDTHKLLSNSSSRITQQAGSAQTLLK